MAARFPFRLLAIVTFGAACSSESREDAPPAAGCPEGTPGCIGWLACPPDMEADPAGAYCREILPADECAPGTTPILGRRECAPVGPTSCGAGFERDPSGWGCRAIVPAQACTGATRDALGATACVPVGDCNAPFPPPAATLFVNAAYTDGELGATKFRTLAAAMIVATSGQTIAVENGTYAEGIAPRSNVTVVGRCPERVRFVGTGLDKHGVLASGISNATVKGVTLFDHYEGARAGRGAKLTLEDVVIEAPRFTGLIAFEANSTIHAERIVVRNVKPFPGQTNAVVSANADEAGTIELVDSAVAGSYEAGLTATNPSKPTAPSVLRITRSVIRDTNLAGNSLAGAAVVSSGTSKVEVADSAILDTKRIGVLTVFDGSELLVQRTEIRRTLQDSGSEVSAAVYAEGGKIALESVSVHDAVQSGIIARTKASLIARDTVVHGTRAGSDRQFGMGAFADQGGKLALERCAFVDNNFYGVSVAGAGTSATLRDVLARGTKAQKTNEGGLGRGLDIEDGASIEGDGVTLLANDGEGIYLFGETKTGERARVTAKRLFVDGGKNADGHGLFVAGGSLAEIDGALFSNSVRAGVIVNETIGGAGSRSEATLVHTIVRDTKKRPRTGLPNEVTLDGFGIASAGNLVVRSSAIVGNVQFGLLVGSPDGATTVTSTFIGSTHPNDDGEYGHGLVALSGSALTARQVEIAGNAVGLFFDGGGAIVSDSRIRNNAIGIHAQNGTMLTEVTRAPDALDPAVVFVTNDSAFVDNATRVGGGELPVPANPFTSNRK